MRSTLRSRLLAVAFLTAPLAAANAQTTRTTFAYTSNSNTSTLVLNGGTTVTAAARGWYEDTGESNGATSTNNYLAGTCGPIACGGDGSTYRNWFRFDLSNFTPLVTSAVLRLDNPLNGYFNTLGSSLDYNLFDVSNFLGLGSGSSMAVYNDLGSGTQYGNTTVTSAQNGTTIEIALNAAALASLNTGRQNGLWAVGGTATTSSVVPEPQTWALMSAGLLGLAVAARRRRQAE